jgi:hypothetical protein
MLQPWRIITSRRILKDVSPVSCSPSVIWTVSDTSDVSVLEMTLKLV